MNNENTQQYVTIERLAEIYKDAGISKYTIYYWKKNARAMGLEDVFLQPSKKKILIDIENFDKWLESRRLSRTE